MLRAAVHPAAAAGHTISVFAANVMLPVSFVLKRVVNARSARAGRRGPAGTAPHHRRKQPHAPPAQRAARATPPARLPGGVTQEPTTV